MKKIALLLLAATSLVTTAQASSFNGFYLGANVGVTQRSDKTTFGATTAAGVAEADYSKSKKSTGFAYGLMAGYGKDVGGGAYLGAELTIGNDTVSKSKSHTLTGVTAETITGTTKYQRGLAVGVAPRVGAVIANSYLLYAKLGVEWSKDRISNSFTGDTLKSGRKTKVVFVPGFGLEKAFGNILGRVEYGYNVGAKISSADTVGTFKTNQSGRYKSHTLKVGVAYKF